MRQAPHDGVASKRRARMLSAIAALVLVMRLVDTYWLVAPAFHQHLYIHWLDLAAPVGLGGLWLANFAFALRGKPLIPQHDPRLEEAQGHGHEKGT